MGITIRGDGVAAYCCAYLLSKAGIQNVLERVDRPRLPAIMLSDHALALIRDVFDKQDLFQDAPRVEKRIVAWEPDSRPLALEHSAVVVSEDSLLASLTSKGNNSGTAPDWTIYGSRPLPGSVQEHRFGSRMAAAVPVTLKESSEPGACWIESLEDGWLFLIPVAPASAWLLAVGAMPKTLLAASRVIANEIESTGESAGEFPAFPRIVSPLCAPGWLACGTAAMAFDPLCGDGTAHAVREAILAAAVIRAVAKEGVNDEILAHYEMRLTAGFRRHLALCHDFYKRGASGPWWERELTSIDEGIAWCDARLTAHREFCYQLRGFELHALR